MTVCPKIFGRDPGLLLSINFPRARTGEELFDDDDAYMLRREVPNFARKFS